MSNENFENNEQTDMNTEPTYNVEGTPSEIPTAEENFAENFYAMPTASQEPLKSKKKKWPIFAGIGGAVAVAGAAAGIYFAFFRTPSFDTPTEAVTACMSQLSTQFSAANNNSLLNEKLNSAEMMNAMIKDGQMMDASFTIEDSDMEEISMLSGVTAEFSYQNDIKNSKTAASMGASFMGIGGSIDLYMEADKLTLASEDLLSDASLYVETDALTELLSAEMTEEEASYFSSMFEQYSSQATMGAYDYYEYMLKHLPDSLVSFAKEWEAKELKDIKTVKAGSQEYDCYAYNVTITAKAFKGFLEDYCSYLGEYDYDSNPLFGMTNELKGIDPDFSINDTMKESFAEIADAIDEDSDDTLDFVMYISPDALLLGADFGYSDEDTEFNFDLRFGDKKHPNDIYMTMTGDNAETSINYVISSTNTIEKDTEKTQMELNFEIDDVNLMNVTVENNYNSKDDTFNATTTADINAENEELSLELVTEGEYTDIVKSKSYSIDYDKILFKVESDDIELPFTTIELSGECTFGVLEDSVKAPTDNAYDLLSLTESDITELMEKIAESPLGAYLLQAIPEDELEEYLYSIMNELV